MTSLLSAISGKFNVGSVLGTILPVTIFVIVLRILLPELFPTAIALPFVTEREVFSLSLVVLVLSGLLHHLNVPLIQLWEGYPWENTALGRLSRRRLQRRFEALAARRDGAAALRDWLADNVPPSPFNAADRLPAWDAAATIEAAVRDTLNLQYPTRAAILPTRLGNAIRSFEVYPNLQYGIEAISLWPRLIAKIDGAFARSIESAKTSFDFALHSATLAGALAGSFAVAKIFGWQESSAEATWLVSAVEIGVPLVLSVWFYRVSIGRAIAWGNTVRAAFDLYRQDLLSQLGYKHAPATVDEERAIWDDISWRITYGIMRERAYSPPRDDISAPCSACSSNNASLRLLRSVEPLANGRLKVALELTNLDAAIKANEVEVRDTVPEGYDLVTDSAQPREDLEISGINPYSFHFKSPIGRSSSATVTYEIEPRPDRSYESVGRKS